MRLNPGAGATLKTLLIVYHSMTGGTAQMAAAVARGAAEGGEIEVALRQAHDAGAEDMLRADAYVFATPENLAAMSGMLKDFFDRTYYALLERLQGRPYATLVCAGSDGTNAVRQIERIATGWRLRGVSEAVVVCTHAQSPEAILAPKHLDAADLERCADIGRLLAAGLPMGVY